MKKMPGMGRGTVRCQEPHFAFGVWAEMWDLLRGQGWVIEVRNPNHAFEAREGAGVSRMQGWGCRGGKQVVREVTRLNVTLMAARFGTLSRC